MGVCSDSAKDPGLVLTLLPQRGSEVECLGLAARSEQGAACQAALPGAVASRSYSLWNEKHGNAPGSCRLQAGRAGKPAKGLRGLRS